jgi:small subunit ribosomal protein S9
MDKETEQLNHLVFNRDSRIKERKKYGLRKARKAPQFSKR